MIHCWEVLPWCFGDSKSKHSSNGLERIGNIHAIDLVSYGAGILNTLIFLYTADRHQSYSLYDALYRPKKTNTYIFHTIIHYVLPVVGAYPPTSGGGLRRVSLLESSSIILRKVPI